MSSENIATRERILKSAWSLLDSGGAAVRMSDIAKDAGISRQALYLHFPSRADLLIATTRYLDEVHDVDTLLVESRTAGNGKERLRAWVDVWGNYIPRIYGVARALMAAMDSDDEAAAAWNDRMQAVRQGCQAAVDLLEKDGDLTPSLTPEEATDLLWSILSVRVWEQLTQSCGWTQAAYIAHMQRSLAAVLVR